MASTKVQLNRYFVMIDRRVPTRVSQFIRWLRTPSSFAVRLVVALLLIVGGFFSFLPILGLWMLPLGLLFIAQDMPLLQKPLVKALTWVEARLIPGPEGHFHCGRYRRDVGRQLPRTLQCWRDTLLSFEVDVTLRRFRVSMAWTVTTCF
jgi:hypothetical protein